MNIFEKIYTSIDHLSKTNRKIAGVVLDMPEEIAFASLRVFADKFGVSTTSVIRFARLYGYQGYGELQGAVRDCLQWRSYSLSRLDTMSQTMMADDIMFHSFSTDIKNLEGTLCLLQEKKELVQQVITMLTSCQRLYMIGLRESFALIHYAWSRFGHIRRGVQVIGAMGNLYEDDIMNVTPKDGVLAFTFPRYARDTLYLLDKLRERKVPIAIVTNNEYDALKKYSDMILPCAFASISYKSNTIGAYAVINYLAVAAAAQNYGLASTQLEEVYEFNSSNPTLL